MGLIQRLFGQLNKSAQPMVNAAKPRDERKAECPACHRMLKKLPGSKTKCPHCGQFMYVRTRPSDQVRVIVTEADANKIDEDWSIINGTHDQFLAEKKAVADEHDALRKRFGKEPSENDVKWGVLSKQLVEHGTAGNWGFYRNTRFAMAEILKKEGRLENALATYLEVCLLDLNGPENRGGVPQELRGEFPFFEPKHAFLAPGIIERIKTIARKLDLREKDIEQLFIKHGKETSDRLRLPIAPNSCWCKLEEQLRSNEK